MKRPASSSGSGTACVQPKLECLTEPECDSCDSEISASDLPAVGAVKTPLQCVRCRGRDGIDLDAVLTHEAIRWGDYFYSKGGRVRGAARGPLCFVCAAVRGKMYPIPRTLKFTPKQLLEFTTLRERYINGHLASINDNGTLIVIDRA